MLAIAVGKTDPTGMSRKCKEDKGKPLAGKSTFNRLELTPADATAQSPYKKIAISPEAVDNLLVDVFLEMHREAPARIILDVDTTDDPLHGNQEGKFFSWLLQGILLPAAVHFLWKPSVMCSVAAVEQRRSSGHSGRGGAYRQTHPGLLARHPDNRSRRQWFLPGRADGLV